MNTNPPFKESVWFCWKKKKKGKRVVFLHFFLYFGNKVNFNTKKLLLKDKNQLNMSKILHWRTTQLRVTQGNAWRVRKTHDLYLNRAISLILPPFLSFFSRLLSETMAFFSAMISLLLLLFSISLTSVHGNFAPAVECSALIVNMAGCLSFVTIGSTVDEPTSSCCTGLKKILDTNAACLCEGLKNSGSMGIKLNVTKASTLPVACKLNAPPVSSCECEISLLSLCFSNFSSWFFLVDPWFFRIMIFKINQILI